MYPVLNKGKYGFIDKAGKMVICPQFSFASDFSEDFAYVRLDGGTFFIKKNGEYAFPCAYPWVSHFSRGLCAFKTSEQHKPDGKFGYLNQEGKIQIDAKYDMAGAFTAEVAAVELNGKWTLINIDGQTISSVKYDFVSEFYEGIASFRKKRRWGLVNTIGEEIELPEVILRGQAFTFDIFSSPTVGVSTGKDE
ncbi:hypothetical protein OpiT1DRAFT_05917 [Opitutaceae bacterium TAV1]|nr:hypothetical protein OpiT1DRAFT_05917 [Opitutaceae bacterium TAV1]